MALDTQKNNHDYIHVSAKCVCVCCTRSGIEWLVIVNVRRTTADCTNQGNANQLNLKITRQSNAKMRERKKSTRLSCWRRITCALFSLFLPWFFFISVYYTRNFCTHNDTKGVLITIALSWKSGQIGLQTMVVQRVERVQRRNWPDEWKRTL